MCYICVTFSYIGVIFMKKIFKVLAFMFLAVAVFSCNHSAKKGKASQASTNQTEDMQKFIDELNAPPSTPIPSSISELSGEKKTEVENVLSEFKSSQAFLDAGLTESDIAPGKYNLYKSEYYYETQIKNDTGGEKLTNQEQLNCYILITNKNSSNFLFRIIQNETHFQVKNISTEFVLSENFIELNKAVYINKTKTIDTTNYINIDAKLNYIVKGDINIIIDIDSIEANNKVFYKVDYETQEETNIMMQHTPSCDCFFKIDNQYYQLNSKYIVGTKKMYFYVTTINTQPKLENNKIILNERSYSNKQKINYIKYMDNKKYVFCHEVKVNNVIDTSKTFKCYWTIVFGNGNFFNFFGFTAP